MCTLYTEEVIGYTLWFRLQLVLPINYKYFTLYNISDRLIKLFGFIIICNYILMFFFLERDTIFTNNIVNRINIIVHIE